MPRWTVAFLAANFLALTLTPTLRQLALVSGFVDVPGVRKVHRDPIPYLGGVALMAAVFGALVFELRLTVEALIILVLAAALGTVGLLDDHRTVHPRLRLLAELAAAAAAVAVGVRVHATGLVPVDLAITVIWIVGVTNALNLMDNMDGLASGVASAATFNVFLLAVLGSQPVVATMAAAMFGACLGFLAYNRPPASIFMGDAGSLFLGFVVAILAVEVNPILSPPVSFVVPLMLLALPVLDTTTVSLARLRRRRPISLGGRDHLSHRLVERGFTPKSAVATLVGAEAILGLLAVLAGRRVLPLVPTLLLAAAVLTVVGALAIPVQVYVEDVVGIPRRLRLAAIAVAVLIPVLAAPAVGALAGTRDTTRLGFDLARRAAEALRVERGDDPAAGFQQAAQEFARARRQLDGPGAMLGLAVPGVSSNLVAARTLASIGERLSLTGMRVVASARSPALRIQGGSVAPDELADLESELVNASRVLHDATTALSDIDRAFLVPAVSRTVLDVAAEVERQRTAVARSLDSIQLARAIFGVDHARRFLLGFRDSRELTGSDALVGSWGELVADHGSLHVERMATVDDLAAADANATPLPLPPSLATRWPQFDAAKGWRQTTLSPDFSTTAQVMAALYERSGGRPVDGVIVVDPPALAQLLELTGPLGVEGWSTPVTPADLADVFQPGTPGGGAKSTVVSSVDDAVVRSLTAARLGDPVKVATTLAGAVDTGHLRIYLADLDGEQTVTRLGAAGDVPSLSNGDSVVVVERDAASAEPAPALRRRMGYEVTLDPRREPARVSGRLQLSLEGGERSAKDGRATPTTTFVSLYSPFLGDPVTVDGTPVETIGQGEDGRIGRTATVSVPPAGVRTLAVNVDGKVQLSPEGWYRLDLLHQPLVGDDRADVTIAVPKGWRIAEVRGAKRVTERLAQASPLATRPRTIWVRVERVGLAGVWDRLFSRH